MQSSGEADTDTGPSLPAEHRQFKDDGTYPSLAQVPARPVNMPTFAEAKKIEKSLQADNATAKNTAPESPTAPAVDSAANAAPSAPPAPKIASAAPVVSTPVVTRTEDQSPCLGNAPGGTPTATVHFAAGSSAITADNLEVLAESMPIVRGAKGTIRVFGHGDTDANAPQSASRFDLATARAGAVAQALTGFGIPTPKIAVGVACRDAATAGASVQLYVDS